MSNIVPKVFISYAWEDDVKDWVKKFADRLISDDIEVYVDQYDLKLGDRLPQFMEQQITSADYVLIICTPAYKNKSDKRIGGAGYEGHIISAELLNFSNERKFIPIIRKGTFTNSMPNFLSGKLGIDLSDSTNQYELNYNNLLTTIKGENHKPRLKIKKNPVSSENVTSEEAPAPITILDIITDELTIPKMDGTRGCALYKVPLRLSRRPSDVWIKIFLQTWQYPPKSTTMHRPDIARVEGTKIILDGTTIEEVRDYHRETLKLCVDAANKKEKEFLEEQHKKMNLERNRIEEHFSTVARIADDINF